MAVLPCYSKEADLKRNNGILRWMKVGPIAFFVSNSRETRQRFDKFKHRNILSLFFAIIYVTCKILEAIFYLLRFQMIFEYRPIFGGMKLDVVLIPDEILSKCKM